MTVPAARNEPRLRRYPLRRLRVPFGNGCLSLVVPRAAAWLHEGGWAAAVAAGREPPYWADVWPASIALGRWLFRLGSMAGCSVLDLGCGLGVPGAVAVGRGAAVTFADLHADALAFAAFNARQQLARADAMAAGGMRIACVQHDWHGPTLPGRFEIVCLADVTYRPVHHPALLRHLRTCLSPAGVAVHTDPFRRESDGFLVQAARELVIHESTIETFFDGRRLPVRLSLMARDEATLLAWRERRGQGPRQRADETASA